MLAVLVPDAEAVGIDGEDGGERLGSGQADLRVGVLGPGDERDEEGLALRVVPLEGNEAEEGAARGGAEGAGIRLYVCMWMDG